MADLVRTPSLAWIQERMIFRAAMERSLIDFMFARMERLPSASCATLACYVLSQVVEAIEYFGGEMAKIIKFHIPQSFHKVSKWLPVSERGKVLAFPYTVTTIGVTNSESRMAKLSLRPVSLL